MAVPAIISKAKFTECVQKSFSSARITTRFSAGPGANDNGSGVAALLALARSFSGKIGQQTLRFVAFVNEEPPFSKQRRWAASFTPAAANNVAIRSQR